MSEDLGNETTGELLDRARSGDAAAFGQLLDRRRAWLNRLIRSRLDRKIGRRVDASDVVQDVLIEASRRLSEYLANPVLPFPIWLRRMAQDRVIDLHRRHRLSERRSVDRERHVAATGEDRSSVVDLVNQAFDPALTPAAAALRNELQQRFLDAVDQLEQDDREIVLLRHFERLSSTEAAEALNLTPAAAGMRYLRALRKLRSHLANLNEE